MSIPSKTGAAREACRETSYLPQEPHAALQPASFSWDEVLAADGYEAWRAHLGWRHTPRPLIDLAPADKTPPLLWSIPEHASAKVHDMLEAASRLPATGLESGASFVQVLMKELAEPRAAGDPTAQGYTRVAWAHACPHVAAVMNGAAWSNLLDKLIGSVEDAAAIPLEDSPLGRLLLGGELPWTLAYLFPELTACRRLASAAEATLSQGLLELLDGEGVPAAKHLPLLRPL
jgi:hypothetical protein